LIGGEYSQAVAQGIIRSLNALARTRKDPSKALPWPASEPWPTCRETLDKIVESIWKLVSKGRLRKMRFKFGSTYACESILPFLL